MLVISVICHGFLLLPMTIEEIENLLLDLSDQESNKQAAIAAFTALYREYSPFLQTAISKALYRMGINDSTVTNTVLNDAFLVVYEQPLMFSFPAGASNDSSFKAWLATVAKNESLRLLKNYYCRTEVLDPESADSLPDSLEVDEEIVLSANHKLMSDALTTLPERDRHILATLYIYAEEGKKTPSDVLDMLCEMHQTTRMNLRKIKERGEKKIREYCIKHSQLSPLRHVK